MTLVHLGSKIFGFKENSEFKWLRIALDTDFMCEVFTNLRWKKYRKASFLKMDRCNFGSLRWIGVKLESKKGFLGPKQEKTERKPKLRQVINDNIAGLLKRTGGNDPETRNDHKGDTCRHPGSQEE